MSSGEPRYATEMSQLGKRLSRTRARVVASGEPLLDWEGIEREVSERRGGLVTEDNQSDRGRR